MKVYKLWLSMLCSDLEKVVVYSRDMVKLGKVKDLVLDPTEMKLTNLIIELEDQAAEDLFSKKPKLRQAKGQVSTSLIDTFKDAIVLKEVLKDLKGAVKSL